MSIENYWSETFYLITMIILFLVQTVSLKLPLKYNDKGLEKSCGDIELAFDNMSVNMNEYPPRQR